MIFVGLCVEWLRARARRNWFKEEVFAFIPEEMRRIKVSLEKHALDWDARQQQLDHITCPILKQGLHAYAAEQAWIRRSLSSHFAFIWGEKSKGDNTTGEEQQEEVLPILEDDQRSYILDSSGDEHGETDSETDDDFL